jgi:hypothetical protein
MKLFHRLIASFLILSMSGIAIPLPAQAGMVGTDVAVAAANRDRISTMLDREDVRQQLQGYGVSLADVKERVAALTDDEAAQLARQMDTAPAGGIIGAIIFVFLVLLITDILGLTKVFPFTRPVR